MLEHITREITVEALPTDIPEQIVVDVSTMEVNDTIQLSSLAAPEGAEFVADDPEEVTIATLTPPRLEKELEEIEEEAALVGEEGEEGAEEGEEVPEGEEAPRARARKPPRAASPPKAPRSRRCGSSPDAAGATGPPPEEGDRDPPGRPGEPRRPLRRNAPQHRLRGRGGALAPLGAAEGQEEVRGPDRRGADRPGGPRVALLLPQTYMNESGSAAGPARRSLRGAARPRRRAPR